MCGLYVFVFRRCNKNRIHRISLRVWSIFVLLSYATSMTKSKFRSVPTCLWTRVHDVVRFLELRALSWLRQARKLKEHVWFLKATENTRNQSYSFVKMEFHSHWSYQPFVTWCVYSLQGVFIFTLASEKLAFVYNMKFSFLEGKTRYLSSFSLLLGCFLFSHVILHSSGFSPKIDLKCCFKNRLQLLRYKYSVGIISSH